jgi:Predicted membrane protein (DUF2207) C-terminal domain/Predicted membrane protein (DUF2207) N-terminal domain
MRLPPLLLRVWAVVLFVALPAAARQIVIKNFDEEVVVHRDSSIDVTERIEVQFVGTDWHGLYRTIPVEYREEGFTRTMFVEDVSARDSDEDPLKLEQSREGPYLKLKIYVPNADNSTHTINLRYHVLNALLFFSDHDELYWNVTGEEWDVPIESASARIELPEGAAGVHAVAYTGAYMSRTQDASVNVSGNIVQVATAHPLGYHQGLTAVVGLDTGLVHRPSFFEKAGIFLRSNWPLLLFPALSFVIIFWLWWTRGRDPERDAITVQYDPPDKLTPAECGTLVDDQVDMCDITATIVDLAVKGYLTIEQKDHSGLLGLGHHRDYVFHLKRQPTEWQNARPHEQEMLSALFDGGTNPDVNLADLQNHFYTHLPPIRDCVFDALVGDGYYLHRPDTVRQGYIGGGIVIGVLIVFLGNWWAKQYGGSDLTWILAGILSAGVTCAFGWFMPARTIAGARTFAKVLGFEDFLSRVESDRIKRLENAPETFEKYLPYAMALRCEKKWVQAFSGIAMQPPQWYTGPVYAGGFQPLFLVTDLNMMASQAGSVMASAPRSVGGSGFGGGGGAGGGFGGGGGGGF